MNIQTKINTFNAGVGALIILGALLTSFQITHVVKLMTQVAESNLPAMGNLGLMNDALKVHRIRTATHIMGDTEKEKEFNAGRVAKQIVQFEENIKAFEHLPNLNQRESVAAINLLWADYVKAGEVVLAKSDKFEKDEAEQLFMAKSLQLYSQISDVIDETISAQTIASEQASVAAEKAIEQLLLAGGIAVLAILAAFIGSSLYVRKALTQSLMKLGSSYKTRKSEIKTATSQSTDSVQTMVAASEETSSQSQMVLGNAAQASKAISEVSRAVQELSSAIQDISRNTTETGSLVDNTVQVAEGAMTVTLEMEAASQRIFQVIEIIKGLADQTNLLALNASIEAARAGEAGRGFAVVADEVKKLASSTADSTNEITLHVQSIEDVTKKTVTAIQNVGRSITSIKDATHSIMSAVQEQSSVAEEITRSLDLATDNVHSAESNMEGIVEAANDTAEASNRVAGNVGEIDTAFSKLDTSLQDAFREIGVKA